MLFHYKSLCAHCCMPNDFLKRVCKAPWNQRLTCVKQLFLARSFPSPARAVMARLPDRVTPSLDHLNRGKERPTLAAEGYAVPTNGTARAEAESSWEGFVPSAGAVDGLAHSGGGPESRPGQGDTSWPMSDSRENRSFHPNF